MPLRKGKKNNYLGGSISLNAKSSSELLINSIQLLLVLVTWIRGSFNICVPGDIVSRTSSRKVIFRCPMPLKLAESRYPGSIDEKLGCEVGASVWVEECCPEIFSPYMFGFGFLDGRHVSLILTR